MCHRVIQILQLLIPHQVQPTVLQQDRRSLAVQAVLIAIIAGGVEGHCKHGVIADDLQRAIVHIGHNVLHVFDGLWAAAAGLAFRREQQQKNHRYHRHSGHRNTDF